MDYQQPHGYMRHPPPPSSAADPFQRSPVPPPPSNHPWPYAGNQFHYQAQNQHSPSAPPPHWPPPPPPPHLSEHAQYPPYPGHHPPPYPAHPHYLPPLPPKPPHLPPQDWGNGGWSQHQQYPNPANNNEEDWAARAKAWAAAKSASDNKHTLSQFVPAGRPEEQNYFHGQYPQYIDGHAPLVPASNYHQFPVAMAAPNGTQSQDFQYMSSGQSSPFAARDGGAAGDSNPPFLPQEKSPITPLVHQQEVPSSYSSVAGNLEAGDRYERLYSSSATPVTDMSDQRLNFAPHFNRDPSSDVQPNYAWPPSTASGAAYPLPPPTMQLGPQVDHPIAIPSPVSGHSAPIFPPGPGFQPTVPMLGAAFGVGAGVTPHLTTFSADAYGTAERPKKVSVPNWLREEIIKNKAVITSSSSAPNFLKEDSQSMEDDHRKGDQSDSKSIDSSGSTEDEDEDEVEAARSAAINQEIKRILTDVLLKVTDELFDEIATKVLKEDDLSVEVGQDSALSNHHILPTTPSVSTPKASAKILIPTKTKGSHDVDTSEKSTSGSPINILGLASYASDEEDEIQSSGKPNLVELPKGDSVIENGVYEEETEELRNVPAELDAGSTGRKDSGSVPNMESNDNMAAKDCKRLSGIGENEFQHGDDTSNLSHSLTEKSVGRNEIPDKKFAAKRWHNNDSHVKNTQNGSDKTDELEKKKSSMKEHPDSESSKGRLDKKEDEEHRRLEERRSRTDRYDYHDNSKDKAKDKGRTVEKAQNTESRKLPSPSDDKEGITVTHRDRRTSSKKDKDEKRKDRTVDDRKERSRNKSGAESSRYKRRRSSSVGARDRENNDNDSSDESSDDSKRKSRHSRRRKSPLPTRTRKRQVSRSPSKHSKRRHSPYSSLETTRGKRSPSRSRSRSPVHRRH